MKRILLQRTGYLLFCIFILAACKKKNDSRSHTDLLIRDYWQHSDYGIDEDKDGNIDIPVALDGCRLDDRIFFNAGGTGSLDQGTDLCYPAEAKLMDFDWQFLANETQLQYGGAAHTILTLDEELLKLYIEEDNSGTVTRYIITYVH